MFQGSPHRTRAGHRYYDYGPLCGAQEKDDETKLFLPVCCRCGFYTSRNILAIRGYVDPLPSVLAIILGILGIYFARMHIDEVIKDKRTQKITEITALRTLQISWVGLFLFALWMIIEALGEEFRHFNRILGVFGFRLLGILCGIIVLYVLLSLYYNKKYGA